ncbi:MAG TPA: DUF29 domain-containing protein, partial [Steroidobacteraceae bacterium]|nr:DUF29 domain-containing protein [Steroidobacteraceae bacterium]
IRKLGMTRRDVPNELDIENVAEEIESVGRSELTAVKSYLRQIFLHLMKLVVEADAPAVNHWLGEIVGFHNELMAHYAPSMHQRINLDAIWRGAREQSMVAYKGIHGPIAAGLAQQCPFNLDELIADKIEVAALLERLRG